MNKEPANKLDKGIFWHYKEAIGNGLFLWFVFNSLLFGVSAYVLNVVIPEYYKEIIDSIFEQRAYESIVYVFYGLAVATGIYFIFDRVSEHLDIWLMVKSLKKISLYAGEKPLDHSYSFFANNFAGALVNKEKKFVGAFDSMTQIILREFLYAIVVVVGVLFVLFKYSFILGVLSGLWFLIFFYTMYASTRLRVPYERERGKAQSITVGVLSDIVTNVLNLKYFSSKEREMKYLEKFVDKESRAREKAWTTAANGYTIQGLVVNLAKLSLLFTSVVLWSYGEITSGVIVLVISYSGILFNKLGNIGSVMRKFAENYLDASEFVEILNTKVDIVDPKNPIKPNITKGEIEFKNVSFGYSNEKNVLENLNLFIRSGEKVGIVGSSGAGKTTFTKLLLRFADVTGGEINIDGQRIKDLAQDDLRSFISYVPQDALLFHRTLRENISYGKVGASEEEVIDVSKKAHAHEFISKLEKGYETLVGERGIKLSGGERQRVAIARAILKKSPILVLDEATSSLDSESEYYIQEALEELMKEKTAIVIAHRLSTVQKMDRIIVLEKGKIVEEGSHKDLIQKSGRYADLWNRQTGGFIE